MAAEGIQMAKSEERRGRFVFRVVEEWDGSTRSDNVDILILSQYMVVPKAVMRVSAGLVARQSAAAVISAVSFVVS